MPTDKVLTLYSGSQAPSSNSGVCSWKKGVHISAQLARIVFSHRSRHQVWTSPKKLHIEVWGFSRFLSQVHDEYQWFHACMIKLFHHSNSTKLPEDDRSKLCLPAPSKERKPEALPGTHCSTKGTSRSAIRNKKSSGIWRFSAIWWPENAFKIGHVNIPYFFQYRMNHCKKITNTVSVSTQYGAQGGNQAFFTRKTSQEPICTIFILFFPLGETK